MQKISSALFILLGLIQSTTTWACSALSGEAKDLFDAIYQNDVTTVARLANRVSLNRDYKLVEGTYNDRCDRPLSFAITAHEFPLNSSQRLEIVKILLKRGASPKNLGMLVTKWNADESSTLELLIALSAHGYKLNVDKPVGYPERQSLLSYYSENTDFPQVIELLARAGSNLNIEMRNGGTPLSYAAVRCEPGKAVQGQVTVVQKLLEFGADPNKALPLRQALVSACSNHITALVNAGAHVSDLQGGFINILSTYLDKALHSIVENGGSIEEVRPTLRLLVAKGLNVNHAGSQSHPGAPLHVAAQYSWPELFDDLVSLGARVDQGNYHGQTALIITAGDPAILVNMLERLLKLGASVNAVDQDWSSALHYASSSGQISKIQMLLNAGANINRQDRFRRTPLVAVFSMCRGQEQMDLVLPTIKELLARGADPKLGDPFAAAVENRCSVEVLRTLKDAGG